MENRPGTCSRVLFFAEVVTLAHAGRPVVLAGQLDPARFDIHLAWDPRYAALFPNLAYPVTPIHSIPSARFLDALANGRPVFDAATLRDYVREDLAVIERVQPDIVIGDFRLSLAISARYAKVPYVTLTNAYWSPVVDQRFPVPDILATRHLPLALAQFGFDCVRPLAFGLHARPLNRVAREFGVKAFGSDLRQVYTNADVTLYADFRELYPSAQVSDRHQFIGPVLWGPDVPLPPWWDGLPGDRPIVFVTVGSSGDTGVLPRIVKELATFPATIVVATAGRTLLSGLPGNVFTTDFLPARAVCGRAHLIVCNGGSPMTQQALAAGAPVLGVCSNMDQLLNMRAVEAAGVGLTLRGPRLKPGDVVRDARTLLDDPAFAARAKEFREHASRYQPGPQCAEIVAELIRNVPE